MITIFINNLLKDEPPVIYGDGEQTRDFVHVQDVVEANVLALTMETAIGEVLNVATGTPTTINQLAAMFRGYIAEAFWLLLCRRSCVLCRLV